MAFEKSRIQVSADDALAPEKFRPVATPSGAVVTPAARLHDTFVQAPNMFNRNTGVATAQLAQALSSIAPGLGRLAGTMQQKQNENDYQKGAQAALDLQKQTQATGLAYKDAIDKGLIDRHQSPFYLKGVREQLGQAMAGKFDDDLHAYLQSDESLKVSTDPKAFDAKVSQFREQWEAQHIGQTTDDDRDFTLGYESRAQAHVDQRKAEFIDTFGQKLKTQSIAGQFSDVTKTITDEIGKVSDPDLVAALEQKHADLIKQGSDPQLVQNTTMRAINNAALRASESDDPLERMHAKQILQLMTKVKGKDGAALNDATDEGRQSYLETLKYITDNRNKFAQLDLQTKQLNDQKTLDDASEAAIKSLRANPNADLNPFLDQVSAVRGGAAEILNLRSTVTAINRHDNEGVVKNIESDIWLDSSKVNPTRIMRSMNRGDLTVDTADRLVSTWRSKLALERQEDAASKTAEAAARRSYVDIVNDPLFVNMRGEQGKQFVGANGILAGASADRNKQASAQLTKEWIQWSLTDGANAGPVQKSDWLQQNSDSLVHVFRKGLVGYNKQTGEPIVGGDSGRNLSTSSESTAQRKIPEVSPADMMAIQRLVRGDRNVEISPTLRAQMNSKGSQEAALKWVHDQYDIYTGKQ